MSNNFRQSFTVIPLLILKTLHKGRLKYVIFHFLFFVSIINISNMIIIVIGLIPSIDIIHKTDVSIHSVVTNRSLMEINVIQGFIISSFIILEYMFGWTIVEQFLNWQWSITVLNLEFSSIVTGCLNKARKLSMSYLLLLSEERRDGPIRFPCEENCKQFHPRFELRLLNPFPMTITIMLIAPTS